MSTDTGVLGSSNNPKWVIYSTYDAEGRADSTSVDQLVAYRSCGFETLIVDTSPCVSAERQKDWERVASKWFKRDNIGYDFGSYKFGIEHLVGSLGVPLEILCLIITNDSCFGPFIAIADLLSEFDKLPEDPKVVHGITDSLMDGHHIQSYWFYFRGAACQLAWNFFSHMQPANNRDEAIKFGELAMGDYLRSTGCRLVVRCPVHATIALLANFNGRIFSIIEFAIRRVLKRWKYGEDADTQCLRYLLRYPDKMRYFNPAVLLAVQLYKTGLSPFVKRSLFRENVYRTPKIPSGLDVHALNNEDVRKILDKA